MFQNRHKLQCEDKERSKNNEAEKDRLQKKDIELCLEVEMDDEVREIITSPERCASTLLDVTVIKPKEIDQIYTAHKKTLNGEEVRKLITSMELEKHDQQKLIEQILCKDDTVVTIHRHSNHPKSAGDYVRNKTLQMSDRKKSSPPRNKPGQCYNSQDSALFFEKMRRVSTTDEATSDILSNYNQKNYRNIDRGRTEQVYTTPRTYTDMKSHFSCKNKSRYDSDDKPKPCLCQNCAIMGVLSDSQKRPFITENMYDPREYITNKKETGKPKRKKSINFKEEGHSECEYYFKYLSAKIRTLEERLSIQEEKSVSRDYFKRIITKLVAHISKITNYGSQEKVASRSQKSRDPHKSKEKDYINLGNRYCVHPLLANQKLDKFPDKKFSSVKTDVPTSSGFSNSHPIQGRCESSFWKWGEEILKPGLDLKNKIIDLLEETLQNLRKPRENVPKVEGNIKNFVDDFSSRLYKTINEVPVRDAPTNKRRDCQDKSSTDPNHSNSTSSVSKPMESDKRNYEKRNKKFGPKLVTRKGVHEEPLNVSYLNPKMKGWQDDSQFSFKFESSDDSARNAEERKLNDLYKHEFMATLSNTKEADKLKLWNSIWNQAKINGQSKQDRVTIQIPDRRDIKNQKIIEIEYTIAELETLLATKDSTQQKNL